MPNYWRYILFLDYFYDIIKNFHTSLNNALDSEYIIYFSLSFKEYELLILISMNGDRILIWTIDSGVYGFSA